MGDLSGLAPRLSLCSLWWLASPDVTICKAVQLHARQWHSTVLLPLCFL